ncbi:MAG: Rrf2 family transcriptional regulator, partial [Planctomycetota bacterium]
MLSAKTEYAVRALLRLSLEYDRGAPVQGKRIASEERIPEGFLAQILGQLKRLGLVTSVRGACGGYRLATPPDRLTLGEAIEMIEGPPAER